MAETRLEKAAGAAPTQHGADADVATPDLNVTPHDDAEDRAAGRAGSSPISRADLRRESADASAAGRANAGADGEGAPDDVAGGSDGVTERADSGADGLMDRADDATDRADDAATADSGGTTSRTEADPHDAESAGSRPLGRRRPRLVQIGAVLIVACAALLPMVATVFYQALTQNGSTLGVMAAVIWLGLLALAAVTIDRGLSRS